MGGINRRRSYSIQIIPFLQRLPQSFTVDRISQLFLMVVDMSSNSIENPDEFHYRQGILPFGPFVKVNSTREILCGSYINKWTGTELMITFQNLIWISPEIVFISSMKGAKMIKDPFRCKGRMLS